MTTSASRAMIAKSSIVHGSCNYTGCFAVTLEAEAEICEYGRLAQHCGIGMVGVNNTHAECTNSDLRIFSIALAVTYIVGVPVGGFGVSFASLSDIKAQTFLKVSLN